MKSIALTIVLAGLCAVGANAACSETVAIGTVEQLNTFSTRVNKGEVDLCGVLISDITYNTNVVNSSKDGVNGATYANWTPIGSDTYMYKGTFDGQNHTIYGLVTTGRAWEPSFVGIAQGGAVVKNLRIADSYFAPNSSTQGGGGAGIIGAVKLASGNTDEVLVDNCSFDGIITGGRDNGGLVASIKEKTKLTISNSYNEGTITGDSGENAGLVGYVYSGATLTLKNCYNVGSAKSNPLVAKNSGTINAENVGCLSSTKSSGIFGTSTTELCNSIVKSGVNVYDDSVTTVDNYNDVISSQKTSNISNLNSSFVGVTFSKNDKGKLVATFTDDTEQLVIPEDVTVDEVVFNRQFTNAKNSTVVLPFNIATGDLGNGTFKQLVGVTKSDNQYTSVSATNVDAVEAYKPYLVTPSGAGARLTVSHVVTLKASEGMGAGYKFADDWTFVPVLTRKRWIKADADNGINGENEEEIGSVYAFAGKASAEGVSPGDFKKIGNKIAASPMRAYLEYSEVKSSQPESKPGLEMAPAPAEIALPDTLPVVFVEPEEVPDPSFNSAPTVYVEAFTISFIDQDTDEGITGLNSVKALVQPRVSRWFNMNGRHVNEKTSAAGAYVNNKTPVTVK